MWLYVVPEVTPFVTGFFENRTSLFPKQLVRAMLLRKHVTCPWNSKISTYRQHWSIFKKKLNKSTHNACNQNTRDLIKNCKFCDTSHPRGKCQTYGKFCHVCNNKNHFKFVMFAAHMLVKKYMNLKKTNLMNPSTRAIIRFLLKLLIFRILHILTKSRIKTLIGQ